jgi:hypothetical protein
MKFLVRMSTLILDDKVSGRRLPLVRSGEPSGVHEASEPPTCLLRVMAD